MGHPVADGIRDGGVGQVFVPVLNRMASLRSRRVLQLETFAVEKRGGTDPFLTTPDASGVERHNINGAPCHHVSSTLPGNVVCAQTVGNTLS
jgi:hypothetical protein